MWILLLLLSLGPNHGQVQEIKYDHPLTKEECVSEQKRLTADFQKAYPGDETFAFACVKQKDKEA